MKQTVPSFVTNYVRCVNARLFVATVTGNCVTAELSPHRYNTCVYTVELGYNVIKGT
jgi:hypothetical protein